MSYNIYYERGRYAASPSARITLVNSPSDGIQYQYLVGIVDGFTDSIAGLVDHAEEARHAQFCTLADDWHANTGHMSSVTQIATHDAYQRIIGMGSDAIPYILDDLRSRGGQWYWALRVLTTKSPVPADADGNISRMKDSWLEWGMHEGLLQRA